MGRWNAALAGNYCDLKAAAYCFDLPEAAIVDHPDSHFYLKSSSFDFCETPNAAEVQGAELLRLINGAIRVNADNYRPIHLWTIHAEDTVGYHICGEYRDRWHRQSALEDRISCDLWAPASAQTASVRQIFHIAKRESAVARAIDLWGADRHGVSIYKIFEIIRDDLGEKLYALTSRSTASRFTGSVNRREVLGDYARHEILPGDPPSKPMTLQEVEHFIQDLLYRWAISKAVTTP
jgi:hypothetical protein